MRLYVLVSARNNVGRVGLDPTTGAISSTASAIVLSYTVIATDSLSNAATATLTVNAVAGSTPTTPGLYSGVVTAIFGNGIASQDINVYLVIPSNSGAGAEFHRDAAAASCTPRDSDSRKLF